MAASSIGTPRVSTPWVGDLATWRRMLDVPAHHDGQENSVHQAMVQIVEAAQRMGQGMHCAQDGV